MAETFLFPSLAWMNAFVSVIVENPEIDTFIEALPGRYRFSVTDTGDTFDVIVDPKTGVSAQCAGNEAVTATVSGELKRWRSIIEGKSDFVMAVLLRKIKIEGDVSGIRAELRQAKTLLNSVGHVPTHFN